MTTSIAAFTRTTRRIRGRAKRLIRRLTRKAEIKLCLTISLPPFLKPVLDYKVDIGVPATTTRPASRAVRPNGAPAPGLQTGGLSNA